MLRTLCSAIQFRCVLKAAIKLYIICYNGINSFLKVAVQLGSDVVQVVLKVVF